MAKMSYAEQLKHPNWQRKRLEVLNASAFECESCGDKETTLHVHHKHYVKGRMAWEYERSELAVLCETCHEDAHMVKERLAAALTGKFHTWPLEEFVFGFLAGFLPPFRLMDEHDAALGARISRPSFDLGVMMAMLGPEDLKEAVKRKVAAGRIDADHPMLKLVMQEEADE